MKKIHLEQLQLIYATSPHLEKVKDVASKKDPTQQEVYECLSWLSSNRFFSTHKKRYRIARKLLNKYSVMGRWNATKFKTASEVIAYLVDDLD